MKRRKHNYMAGIGDAMSLGYASGIGAIGVGAVGGDTTAFSKVTPFMSPIVTLGATRTTLHLTGKLTKQLRRLPK